MANSGPGEPSPEIEPRPGARRCTEHKIPRLGVEAAGLESGEDSRVLP